MFYPDARESIPMTAIEILGELAKMTPAERREIAPDLPAASSFGVTPPKVDPPIY
jgi:hypothetical protein